MGTNKRDIMNIEKFFKAIKTGDLSTVRQALESGMSPNAIRAGQNALDVACFHGHDAIVNLLLNPLSKLQLN